MSYESIAVTERYDGQVVEIALGPPPGNIVGMSLMEELNAELDRIDAVSSAGSALKLIVVTGQGKHFSYGASVEEHRAEVVGDMLPRFHALIRRWLRCPTPTVAKVSGACLGGGFELALACSMILCSDRAKLGVPEITLGVFPPAASVLLPRKAGDAVVSELVLTGRMFSAAELHRAGVVNHVMGDENADGEFWAFVEENILPRSASSLRIAWQVLCDEVADHWDARIPGVERLYLERLMATADANEGIEAFLQKREPTWANR